MQLTKSQRGFAMVEVMVTVVIIAIGISGMGLLLLRAVQGTQDSAQLSQSMWIVHDYIGRIRANPDGARDGLYIMDSDNISCSAPTQCTDAYKQSGGINTIGSWEGAEDCSVNQMAVYDNWSSTCSLHTDLEYLYDSPSNFIVGARLKSECISPNPTNCVEYKVTLSWKTKIEKESSDSTDRTYDNEYSAIVGIN
jgi:prepilin-type N-terminal cleavage/methylation domain-containing protein